MQRVMASKLLNHAVLLVVTPMATVTVTCGVVHEILHIINELVSFAAVTSNGATTGGRSLRSWRGTAGCGSSRGSSRSSTTPETTFTTQSCGRFSDGASVLSGFRSAELSAERV